MAAASVGNPGVPDGPPTLGTYYDVTSTPTGVPSGAKGAQVTFTITGWSTDDVPPWTIQLGQADGSDIAYSALNAQLTGASMLGNGMTATLTMTAPATATSGQIGGVYIYSGPEFRIWPVAFVVQ